LASGLIVGFANATVKVNGLAGPNRLAGHDFLQKRQHKNKCIARLADSLARAHRRSQKGYVSWNTVHPHHQ